MSRRPIAREVKRRALGRPYGRLLTITRRTLRQAAEAVKRAKHRRNLSGHARRSVRTLKRLARLGTKVVAQTKERVFKGNAKSSEKLVSIFEPQTKIIRRGKAGKPPEFGQMVKVQEVEGGLITDVGVVEGTDHALLVPSVERHKDVFGRVPDIVATDRGFFKMANVRRIEALFPTPQQTERNRLGVSDLRGATPHTKKRGRPVRHRDAHVLRWTAGLGDYSCRVGVGERVRGRPERGASASFATGSSAFRKRSRHSNTVRTWTPTSFAVS